MSIRDLKTEVESVVEPILSAEGFDLIEIKLSRYKKNFRLQLYIDSDDGVTIDNCAHLSRLAGASLDLADLFDGEYVLEISSPGIDRALTSGRDFRRKIGKEVKITLTENGGPKTVQGILTEVTDSTVILTGKKGSHEISLNDVSQGKIII